MTEIITVLSSDVSILSSIAVSRLMPVYDLSTMSVSADQYKLLVSEPCEDTSTKHISKFVPLGDVISVIRRQFNVDGMSSDVKDLSSNKSDRREVEIGDRGGWFICETQKNPYIISSIYETNNGNISALGGYDLSTGINEALRSSTFDSINVLSVNSRSISSGNIVTLSLMVDALSSRTISSLSIVANQISGDNIHGREISSDVISCETLCCTTLSDMIKESIASSSEEAITDAVGTIVSSKLVGKLEDVMYTTPTGPVKQSILNSDILVCDNDEDLEKCMDANVSFSDIFKTWKKGGHWHGKWYGFTEGYPISSPDPSQDLGYKHWYYDTNLSTIVQPNNTRDDSFIYSSTKYQNYDLSVRCYSTGADDDLIGLVLAFIEDGPDGNPHALYALRSPNTTNREGKPSQADYHWYVAESSAWVTSDTYKQSVVKSDVTVKDDLSNACWWGAYGAGTVIHARRNGSVIELETTPFMGGASTGRVKYTTPGNTITLDLAKDCGGIFNRPASIGYISRSQPYTMYENLKFNVEKTVVDTRSNTLSTYNPIEQKWEQKSTGVQTLETCGFGRLVKNVITQDVFYVTQNGFERISEKTETVVQTDDKLKCEKWQFFFKDDTSQTFSVVLSGN